MMHRPSIAHEGPAAAPRPWWELPILLGGMLAFLLIGLWLGWTALAQRVAGQVATVSLIDQATARQQIEIQQQVNAALEREAASLRETLVGDVCELPPAEKPR
jgi:hypothetical protein